MSEYTPTPVEARAEYVVNKGFSRVPVWRAYWEFDRMIAEVERAAAEKAWDACLDEVATQGTVQFPVNPYREGKR